MNDAEPTVASLGRSPPAAERNKDAILAVLAETLPASGTILEVASGSGRHAAHFARALPGLVWQPSDPDPENRRSIAAWAEAEGLPNLRPPLALDACASPWPIARADAVLCINMIHIAPWDAALGLFAGAARILPTGGPLVLYGPFHRDGAPTSPGNARFDAELRAENPRWGVRDLGATVEAAGAAGLALDRTVAMPANNHCVVLRRA